jgi:hypothetical protein
MNTEELRKQFESDLQATNLDALFVYRFQKDDGIYLDPFICSAWGGYQLRAKAELTEDQRTAIEVSLVYLDDKLAESNAAAEDCDDDEEKDMWSTNSAAIRRHIATLAAMLPEAK